MAAERGLSPGRLVRRRFLRGPLSLLGLAALGCMALFSLLGPLLWPAGEYQVFYRSAQGAVVREGPGVQYAPVLSTADGAALRLLGQVGEWYHVLGDGYQGYLRTRAVRLLGGDEAAALLSERPELAEYQDQPRPTASYEPIVPSSQLEGRKKWQTPEPTPQPTPEPTQPPQAAPASFEGYRPLSGWAVVVESGERLEPGDGVGLSGTVADRLAPPSAVHPMGTDALGRDVLARLMYGGRVSLLVGLAVVALELAVGVSLGGLAGYYGGLVDGLIMRLVDVFNCLPMLPIQLILSAMLLALPVDPRAHIYLLMLVMALVGWPSTARMVRGQILSLREQEFMLAEEATGMRARSRIFRHLVPGVAPQLIVLSTLGVGSAILSEASLSFLGLGVKFPYSSWGNMVSAVSDKDILLGCPWVWVPPGLCILITVLSFNFVGDGLRDAFDPRMKGRL